jgi:hypothetical protein
MELARGGRAVDINMDSDSSDDDEDGEFYTEGTDDLLEARRKLATYSLQRWASCHIVIDNWTYAKDVERERG